MMTVLEEPSKVPLNDYFIKLNKRREENKTTADFL
jgi:hypothetical protein